MNARTVLSALDVSAPLRPEDVELAAGPIRVELDEHRLKQAEDAEEFVAAAVADGRRIYGISTGYGALVDRPAREDAAANARGLVEFLSAGQGEPLPPAVSRGMLLCRLWCLARGHSGIGLPVLHRLRDLLATNLAPVVPEFGSVGASGDLVPLAHAVAALSGEGQLWVGTERVPAAEALAGAGLAPLELAGRDALALVNGTSLTASAAGLAVAQAKRSLRAAIALSAQLTELLGAVPGFADPDLLAASGHPGAERAGGLLLSYLDGAWSAADRPLQEVYSVRCVPQLVGAAWSALDYVEATVTADLNGISDNPLFFPEQDKIAHGGNFFGQPVAFAADLLSIVLTQLGNLAERQLDLLVDPHRNGGLPPLLATDPGRQHGVTGAQLTATALVVAMRRNAIPASVQSLPTNHHNQDVVPFGNQAALTALRQANMLRWLHGTLAVALRQAVHLNGRPPLADRGAALHDAIASAVPGMDADRPLDGDIRAAADVLDDAFRAEAASQCPVDQRRVGLGVFKTYKPLS